MVKKLLLCGIFAALLILSACQSGQDTPSVGPSLASPTPTQVAAVDLLPTSTSPAALESTPEATDQAETPVESPEAASPSATPQTAPQTTPESTSETAPPASPTPAAPAGPKECQDVAAFYADLTIPDGTLMRPGETFTKTWRVRNNGTCAWENGYVLVFAGGEIMGGPFRQDLERTAPGEIRDISIDLTAPAYGGQYLGNWWFEDGQGRVFGTGASGKGALWTLINVTYVGGSSPTGGSTGAATTPTGGTGGTSPVGSCNATPDPAYASQILALINNARQANGLNPLSFNEQLNAAALQHSSDMACNNLLSHTGSDGSSWYQRVERQGFANSASARENIYAGDPSFGGDPNGAFNWWMNSQIHRDNILFRDISVIGIGYVYSPSSQFGGYYTAVFARP